MPISNLQCAARVEEGKDGKKKLVLVDPEGYRQAIWRMKPGPKVLRIEEPRTKRSLDQNAYWHAAVFPPIADHLGYTIPECKLVLMGECFGWKELAGHEVPLKPSTSDMTVEEGTYFTDWVIPWAATELGVTVMLPNEYMERAS